MWAQRMTSDNERQRHLTAEIEPATQKWLVTIQRETVRRAGTRNNKQSMTVAELANSIIDAMK